MLPLCSHCDTEAEQEEVEERVGAMEEESYDNMEEWEEEKQQLKGMQEEINNAMEVKNDIGASLDNAEEEPEEEGYGIEKNSSDEMQASDESGQVEEEGEEQEQEQEMAAEHQLAGMAAFLASDTSSTRRLLSEECDVLTEFGDLAASDHE